MRRPYRRSRNLSRNPENLRGCSDCLDPRKRGTPNAPLPRPNDRPISMGSSAAGLPPPRGYTRGPPHGRDGRAAVTPDGVTTNASLCAANDGPPAHGSRGTGHGPRSGGSDKCTEECRKAAASADINWVGTRRRRCRYLQCGNYRTGARRRQDAAWDGPQSMESMR